MDLVAQTRRTAVTREPAILLMTPPHALECQNMEAGEQGSTAERVFVAALLSRWLEINTFALISTFQ
jgi:hypothetical protein